MGADAPDRGLQSGDAAARGGRRTEPPVSVPMAQGTSLRRHGHPRPLLDPPGVRGHPGVPRILRRAQMLVGAPAAIGELDRVRLAEHDHAGGDHAAPRGRGEADRRSRQTAAAAGGDPPSMSTRSFSGDRDAVQRADGMAGADSLVRGLGREPRVRGVNFGEGVELRLGVSMRARYASTTSTGESRRAAMSAASLWTGWKMRSLVMTLSRKHHRPR